MHTTPLASDDLYALTQDLRRTFERIGAPTSSAIARLTGINQSQVYRNLFRIPKRRTKTLDALCKYAKKVDPRPALDPASSSILMHAMAVVWDGTDEQARRIAEVLLAMHRVNR
jgi:hypothetical protein